MRYIRGATPKGEEGVDFKRSAAELVYDPNFHLSLSLSLSFAVSLFVSVSRVVVSL